MDDTKIQELIADVMRAATTRIGAPTMAQATLMGDALKTAGGVYGNQALVGIHDAQNALKSYEISNTNLQGQKPTPTDKDKDKDKDKNVTPPSLGVGGGITGLTPVDTDTTKKIKLSKVAADNAAWTAFINAQKKEEQ
jgi:hypothetical protein